MYILRIEHPVPDYDAWKKNGFDNDPIGREKGGVKGYKIYKSEKEPNYVYIDLEFDNLNQAEQFQKALQSLWGNVQSRFGWQQLPKSTIIEQIEEKTY